MYMQRKMRRSWQKKAATVAAMAAFSATTFSAGSVYALPTDGQVTAGDTTIAKTSDKQMDIDQHSSKTAIDWKGFDIAQGETVNFHQPDASAIALNRINSNKGSEIYGNLNANGKVFLINPNGVLFGKGAAINVGGLVASTKNITNADFMDGKYNFAGDSTQKVINNATIKAEGGVVALLANQVENNGTIDTKGGSTKLAAGNAFHVDYEGDGKINLTVNAAAVDAKVLNTGSINADGGYVYMTARDASNVLNTVVNNTGTIEAKSLKKVNGEIVLDGGDQGVVSVGGSIDASGDAMGETGGNIKVNGADTEVQNGASLKATGDKAGGFIETSGTSLNVADGVNIDTSSVSGQAGEWLLDPQDITISDGTDSVTDTKDKTGTTYTSKQNASVLNIKTLNRALDGKSNVTITTAAGGGNGGDINVNADILKTSAGTTTLTMNAVRDINLNGAAKQTNDKVIDSQGGALNVVLNNNLGGEGGAITVMKDINTNGGNIQFGSSTSAGTYIGGVGVRSITTKGGDVTFNGDVALGNTTAADSYTNAGTTIDTTNGAKGGSVLFNGNVDSGNRYDYVAGQMSWTAARNDAEKNNGKLKATDAGYSYLTTITSALENARVRSAATDGTDHHEAWAGGQAVDKNHSDWRWVTGPEGAANNGQGTQFYYRDATADSEKGDSHPGRPVNGSHTNQMPADKAQHLSGTVDGMYNNFNDDEKSNHSSEPNNWDGQESYLEVNFRSKAKWNDYSNTNGAVQGYVKETNLTAADLNIKAGNGDVTFNKNAGANKALNNLTITTTGNVTSLPTDTQGNLTGSIHTEQNVLVQAGSADFGGMIIAGKTSNGSLAHDNANVEIDTTKQASTTGNIATTGVEATGMVKLLTYTAGSSIDAKASVFYQDNKKTQGAAVVAGDSVRLNTQHGGNVTAEDLVQAVKNIEISAYGTGDVTTQAVKQTGSVTNTEYHPTVTINNYQGKVTTKGEIDGQNIAIYGGEVETDALIHASGAESKGNVVGIDAHYGDAVVKGDIQADKMSVQVVSRAGNVSVGNITADETISVISYAGSGKDTDGDHGTVGKDVTLNGILKSNIKNASEAVVVGTKGNFINNRGKDAIQTGNGSAWKVFSYSPDNDTFGNLNSGTNAIWNKEFTLANLYGQLVDGKFVFSSILTDPSNRYIFAVQPTVVVTADNMSKTYGDKAAAHTISYTPTLNGKNLVTEYKGQAFDESKVTFSGATASSKGDVASATRNDKDAHYDSKTDSSYYDINVDTKGISATVDNKTADNLDGYLVTNGSTGKLTVNRRILTETVMPFETQYGDTTGAAKKIDDSVNLDNIAKVNNDTKESITSSTSDAYLYDKNGQIEQTNHVIRDANTKEALANYSVTTQINSVNYAFADNNGKPELSKTNENAAKVTPADLTVTPEVQGTYGDSQDALKSKATYTYQGWKYGEGTAEAPAATAKDFHKGGVTFNAVYTNQIAGKKNSADAGTYDKSVDLDENWSANDYNIKGQGNLNLDAYTIGGGTDDHGNRVPGKLINGDPSFSTQYGETDTPVKSNLEDKDLTNGDTVASLQAGSTTTAYATYDENGKPLTTQHVAYDKDGKIIAGYDITTTIHNKNYKFAGADDNTAGQQKTYKNTATVTKTQLDVQVGNATTEYGTKFDDSKYDYTVDQTANGDDAAALKQGLGTLVYTNTGARDGAENVWTANANNTSNPNYVLSGKQQNQLGDYEVNVLSGNSYVTPATINLTLTGRDGGNISDGGSYARQLTNGDQLSTVPTATYSYSNGSFHVFIGGQPIQEGDVVGNYKFNYDGVMNYTPTKPQLDHLGTSNLAGSGAYGMATPQAPDVIKVKAYVNAQLPFFRVADKQVSNYGTYDVSESSTDVKLTPSAKNLPEPNKEKNQYRSLARSFDLTNGLGNFNLVYDGTDFNIYPTDDNAKALLAAGDPEHNVEIASKALLSSFNEMGLLLEDFDAVYVHTDATEDETKA